MAQWIVFDEATVKPLAARTHQDVEVAAGDLLEVALAAEGPSLVLGAGNNGRVQVVNVRRSGQQGEAPRRYVAGGFLGLTDEIAEDEPPREQSWWRKLWE